MSKSQVVALTWGKRMIKPVFGERRLVVPFLGLRVTGKGGWDCETGVGVLLLASGQTKWWPIMGTYSLLQFWRAMKFLEQVPEIQEYTLSTAYYFAGRVINERDRAKVEEELLPLLGGFYELERARSFNQCLSPWPEDLDHMLKVMKVQGVRVEGRELAEEVETGHLKASPRVAGIIGGHRRFIRKYPLPARSEKPKMVGRIEITVNYPISQPSIISRLVSMLPWGKPTEARAARIIP